VHAPRDPAWTADGIVADRWAPISPVTRTLDAFQWRVPIESAEHEDAGALASKAEALAALGVDRHTAPADEPAPRTAPATDPRRRAETIEPDDEPPPPPSAASEDEEAADERGGRPTRRGEEIPQPAARSAPTRPSAEARSTRRAARPAAKTRPPDEENGRTRVFVAPHAPDDPGPDSPSPDDPPLPLRPQRA
jgi:HemY protein